MQQIFEIIGFDPYHETDHTQTQVAKITGIVRYMATGFGGGEDPEEFVTVIRPGENNAWNLNVIEAAQAWLDAGGVIPEWKEPTADERRQTMQPLSARQFRLGLISSGKELSQVDAAIAAIPDATERGLAEVEWGFATTFKRAHPLVVSLSLALGFTPEEVDTLWGQALLL